MLKRTQRAIQRDGIILFAAFIGITLLAGVGAYLLNGSRQKLIKQQAERKAEAWAEYVGATLPRINEITNGGAISNEELRFLKSISEFGDVFSFKLFNALNLIFLNKNLSSNFFFMSLAIFKLSKSLSSAITLVFLKLKIFFVYPP